MRGLAFSACINGGIAEAFYKEVHDETVKISF
jgi:hypothetical protein